MKQCAIFLAAIAIFRLATFTVLPTQNLLMQESGWDTSHAFTPTTSIDNAIVRENAHPGTRDWYIPAGKVATTQIQAYVGARSVAPGHSLAFYVSTQEAGTRYAICIYRMGWYHGLGGRLMTTIQALRGQAQGYYNPHTWTLVHCRTCYVNTQTGLIEARWKRSYALTIPSGWTTGVYLVKFIDAHGFQSYTDFDVLGNNRAAYAVVTADTTYAAYNNWGGRCLYADNSKPVPASKVSFLRPSTQQNGSDQVLIFEADAIHWLERNGYDLSYLSSIDLQTNAAQLLKHKAYISLGHDEYWSKEMRDGVESARDHGVGLAFLEADDAYWQVRFEPSTTGSANATMVCYKVSTFNHDLSRDPLYGHDNARVTSQWRDPVVNRPENALIGIMYSHFTHKQRGFPWQVNQRATSTLLRGTDLVPGQEYDCGVVGYEWDRVFSNGATPRGLQILATSATVSDRGKPDSSNTSVYIAPSGAMVFATGSIYWTAALDTYRYNPDAKCAGKNIIVGGIQRFMSNVMAGLVVRHHRSFWKGKPYQPCWPLTEVGRGSLRKAHTEDICLREQRCQDRTRRRWRCTHRAYMGSWLYSS
ncbi:MAG TPA: N,N-dimethylformamidase beta subunit family domain-containing protein [Ktedonobacteraceae bacterium]|jgi:hypothetical protein